MVKGKRNSKGGTDWHHSLISWRRHPSAQWESFTETRSRKISRLLFIVWKGSWFWLFTHFGQNQLPLHSKMLNSSDCCEGSVLTEDIWIISEKWKWNFNCKLVFQKFASVGSCQWKWKDVCFALKKISSEIQTENGTYGQIWSTWICFAKPTSSKPTRLSVLERDLMLCGARAFPFALPSACRWPPWLPA